MRDKINNLLPLGDVRLSIGVLETAVRPDIYLDCFSSTDLWQLSKTIFSPATSPRPHSNKDA